MLPLPNFDFIVGFFFGIIFGMVLANFMIIYIKSNTKKKRSR